MIDLMFSCTFLPVHAPLAPFGIARGNLSVWTRARVTAALCGVVALTGLLTAEQALRSLRIGSVIFLLVGGVSEEEVQRKGRWKSDLYKSCIRSHEVDAKVTSDKLADADTQPGLQPG